MHAVRACYLLETDLNRWGFSSRSFSSISRSSGLAACSISSALSTLMLLGGRLRSSNVRMGLGVCQNILERYRCLPFFCACLSSLVFALRNGFDFFSFWLIKQIYRYKTTHRNSIVQFHLHRQPSPARFSFSSSQFLKPLAESSSSSCNRKQVSTNPVGDNLQVGADFRIEILSLTEGCYQDSHRQASLTLKNPNP